MNRVEKIVKKTTKYMAFVSVAGYAWIMLLTVCDVILRYVLNSPIIGSYEMIECSMIFTVYLSFAYCQMERGHVRVTLLIARFPRRMRFAILAFLGIISTAMCIFMLYAAQMQAQIAYASNYQTAVVKIPLYPFYWAEVISMAVLCITFIFDTAENIFAVFNKKMADHLQQFLV